VKYNNIKDLLFWIFLSFHTLSIAQDLEWARQLGGLGQDRVSSVTVDGSGNVYSVGTHTATADFDPDTSTYNLSPKGIYISKLDRNGNFVWAKNIDCVATYYVNKIILDHSENIYVSGKFMNTSYFQLSSGTDSLISNGYHDGFICKLDSNGSLLWHENIGGAYSDGAGAMAVNQNNDVLVTGSFNDTVDFDFGTGVHNLISLHQLYSSDGYIQKLDSSGNLLWVKHITTSEGYGFTSDIGFNSANFDSIGNCYFSGTFSGSVDFTPETPGNTAYTSWYKSFILKLDVDGNFLWVKILDAYKCITTLDEFGDLIATGTFLYDFDVDPGTGTSMLYNNGVSDVYILKIDSNANFIWGTSFGGIHSDHVTSISTDEIGNLYIYGSFENSVDFDPGLGNHTLSCVNSDAYILKLNGLSDFQWVRRFASSSLVYSNSIFVDDSAYIYSTGVFHNTTDFDPDTGSFELTNFGQPDVFVCKMSNCETSYYTLDTIVCEEYISPSGNYTWAIDGDYIDTIPNTRGCDSILFINLTVDNPYHYMSINACDTLVSPSGNYIWDSSGLYLDTLSTINGCDSILEILLSIHNSTDSIAVVTCTEYLSSTGELLTSSGIYIDSLVNVYGCDSVLFLDLIIHSESTDTLTVFECDEYIAPSGNLSWTSTGIYYDTLMNMAGCDSLLVIDLTIQEDLNPYLGPDISLCEGESLILNASVSGDGFLWQDGSVDSTYTVTESGIYWVAITADGCTERDTISIHFNTIPETIFGSDTILCEGETLFLSAYHPNSSYTWQDGTIAPTKLIDEAGLYWVDIVVPGCGTFRDSILVEYVEGPSFALGADTLLCEGETLLLDISNAVGAVQWQDGSTGDSFLVEHQGSYYVQVDNGVCSGFDTIDVSYLNAPNFDFGVTKYICAGDTFHFNFTDHVVNYLWQDGSTKSDLYATTEGWYSLTQSNICGEMVDSVFLAIEPCTPKLNMPNVFSPNGDGTNDYFSPISMENISVISFAVFNRWGIQLHVSKEQEIQWNGENKKGTKVNNGQYFWVLKYSRNGNGKMLKKKGSVNVFY